jgi:hypothetical protein
VTGHVSSTKILLILQFIISLLVCQRLLTKPSYLQNLEVLPFLISFPNLSHITLRRNISILRNTKNLNLIITTVFLSYYHQLVKTTIKADRWNWLNTTDDNFRAHPKHFENIFINLKGMINLLPKFKLNTKLLHSHNLLQKPLQTTFLFLILPLFC